MFDHKFNEYHAINAVAGATFERGRGETESTTALISLRMLSKMHPCNWRSIVQ